MDDFWMCVILTNVGFIVIMLALFGGGEVDHTKTELFFKRLKTVCLTAVCVVAFVYLYVRIATP